MSSFVKMCVSVVLFIGVYFGSMPFSFAQEANVDASNLFIVHATEMVAEVAGEGGRVPGYWYEAAQAAGSADAALAHCTPEPAFIREHFLPIVEHLRLVGYNTNAYAKRHPGTESAERRLRGIARARRHVRQWLARLESPGEPVVHEQSATEQPGTPASAEVFPPAAVNGAIAEPAAAPAAQPQPPLPSGITTAAAVPDPRIGALRHDVKVLKDEKAQLRLRLTIPLVVALLVVIGLLITLFVVLKKKSAIEADHLSAQAVIGRLLKKVQQVDEAVQQQAAQIRTLEGEKAAAEQKVIEQGASLEAERVAFTRVQRAYTSVVREIKRVLVPRIKELKGVINSQSAQHAGELAAEKAARTTAEKERSALLKERDTSLVPKLQEAAAQNAGMALYIAEMQIQLTEVQAALVAVRAEFTAYRDSACDQLDSRDAAIRTMEEVAAKVHEQMLQLQDELERLRQPIGTEQGHADQFATGEEVSAAFHTITGDHTAVGGGTTQELPAHVGPTEPRVISSAREPSPNPLVSKVAELERQLAAETARADAERIRADAAERRAKEHHKKGRGSRGGQGNGTQIGLPAVPGTGSRTLLNTVAVPAPTPQQNKPT